MVHTLMCFQCFRGFPNAGIPPQIGWFVCFQCLHSSYIPAEGAKASTGTHHTLMYERAAMQRWGGGQ